jgi:hypothetical protein
MEKPMDHDRLFAGVFAGGISYADRAVQEHGDYKKLGFLNYATLELTIEKSCPADLADRIRANAAKIQARKGEHYKVSTVGQTVLLGSRLND